VTDIKITITSVLESKYANLRLVYMGRKWYSCTNTP